MRYWIFLFLAVAVCAEQLDGILNAVPTDILSGVLDKEAKSLPSEAEAFEKKGSEKSKPLSILPRTVKAPLAGPGKMLKAAAVVAAPVKKYVNQILKCIFF